MGSRRMKPQECPLYKDEIRSVAVGYGEVGSSNGLDFAFAQQARGRRRRAPSSGVGFHVVAKETIYRVRYLGIERHREVRRNDRGL